MRTTVLQASLRSARRVASWPTVRRAGTGEFPESTINFPESTRPSWSTHEENGGKQSSSHGLSIRDSLNVRANPDRSTQRQGEHLRHGLEAGYSPPYADMGRCPDFNHRGAFAGVSREAAGRHAGDRGGASCRPTAD